MSSKFPEGYYITGYSFGSSKEGPLRPRRAKTASGHMMEILRDVLDASQVGVTVEYGVPVVDKFDPFEPITPGRKIFQLARDNDPILRHSYEIQRVNPDQKYMPKGRKVYLPSSYESDRIFDVKLIQFLLESAAYYNRRDRAYSVAVKRAGLVESDRPKLVNSADSQALEEYRRLDSEFMAKVVENVTIPRPLAVRVEGLDSILDKFPH